ncbi:MAG: hypothetical protein O3A01_08445 [bacterium]|nr:hypothetical protein [bacterium]
MHLISICLACDYFAGVIALSALPSILPSIMAEPVESPVADWALTEAIKTGNIGLVRIIFTGLGYTIDHLLKRDSIPIILPDGEHSLLGLAEALQLDDIRDYLLQLIQTPLEELD